MKCSVSEFAKLTGVSVRTLHYYDQIGLLKPDEVDSQNGYRFYGETALQRMREILFYRELDFSLATIGQFLSSPEYNKEAILREQRTLLLLKRERLDNIICLLDSAAKGEKSMDFSAFDKREIEAYADEVKRRWGDTSAYTEYTERGTDSAAVVSGLESIIAAFASLKKAGERADSDAAKMLVSRLQAFITETQYTCTDEILLCLGEMYVGDERFTRNIDKAGDGTAAFMRSAIRVCCGKTE